MSKSHSSSAKHMSADAADRFEEEIEGDVNEFGNLSDWEMELGLQILKIESKIAAGVALQNPNVPVINMLKKKLATYNAALLLLDRNEKVATTIGSKGGLQAIIAYITKQAVEDATKAETREYSNMVMKHLPGYKLSRSAPQMGGIFGINRVANGNKVNMPEIDGGKLLSF